MWLSHLVFIHLILDKDDLIENLPKHAQEKSIVPSALDLSERLSSFITATGVFEMPPSVWLNNETGEYEDNQGRYAMGDVIGC
jgi:hypothetical protein